MGFELTLIFAFLAMICWGFGDFFIQKCSRKIGDVEALAYIGLIGGVIFLPFIINDFSLMFKPSNIIFLIFFSIITFVVALFNFEALKQGKLSIIDVILELELPITIILGFAFFKETLSIIQFIIIGLIFAGIILIATESRHNWKFKLEKGVILAIIAAIGMGLINFLAAQSSRAISPSITIFSVWIITALFCFVYLAWKKRIFKFLDDGLKYKKIVLPMAIFDTFAWFFFMLAVIKNEISITTAITESYPAIAIMLGVFINKEKINWHQYFGAGLALIASFALAFLV